MLIPDLLFHDELILLLFHVFLKILNLIIIVYHHSLRLVEIGHSALNAALLLLYF